MREYKKCTICNLHHFTDLDCPNIYFINHEYLNGYDEIEVRANSFEHAATVYAQTHDYENELIKEGAEWSIAVRKGDITQKYIITATARIAYYAKEIS